MSQERHDDWLEVVYGAEAGRRHSLSETPRTEITVRQNPSELGLTRAPGGQQQVRVSVVPSAPNLQWRLFLRDLDAEPGRATPQGVSWRIEPDTWHRLAGPGQCVATGRGRARLDVELRIQRSRNLRAELPRLRFVAECVEDVAPQGT